MKILLMSSLLAEQTNEENNEVPETFEQEQGQGQANTDSNLEFEKKEEEEQEDKKEESNEEEESEDKEDKEEDDKKKYSLLEQKYQSLEQEYNQLKADYESLVSFKKEIEDKEKDALINEFYMLSNADKQDVIDHKSEYTLEEIKAKLSVICFEKKVNFSLEDQKKNENNKEENTEIYNFTYSNDQMNLPDWVKAVKNIQENN